MKRENIIVGELYSMRHPRKTWGGAECVMVLDNEAARASTYSSTPQPDPKGTGIAVHVLSSEEISTLLQMKPADRLTMYALSGKTTKPKFAMLASLRETWADRAVRVERERKQREKERIEFERRGRLREAEAAKKIKEAKALVPPGISVERMDEDRVVLSLEMFKKLCQKGG